MKIGNIEVEIGNVVLAKRKKRFLIIGSTLKGDILFFNLGETEIEELSAEDFIERYGKIIKVYRDYRINKIEWEKKKEILDEVEKKYLLNVIRPFRERVKGIILVMSAYSSELVYIRIVIEEGLVSINPYIDLPVFQKGTMYRGMNLNYNYKLEELGI